MNNMDAKARNEERAAELVIAAIAGLQEEKGSTLSKITKFITSRYEVDEKDIKQPVRTALRRGVLFGFLEKEGAVYKISPNYEVSRPRQVRKPSKAVKRAGKRKPSTYNRKRSPSRSRRNTQK